MSGNRSYHSSDGFRKHMLSPVSWKPESYSSPRAMWILPPPGKPGCPEPRTWPTRFTSLPFSNTCLPTFWSWWAMRPRRLQDSQGNGQPPAAPSRLWQGRQISGSWNVLMQEGLLIPESQNLERVHTGLFIAKISHGPWSPVLLTVAHVINKLKHMDVLLAPLSCSHWAEGICEASKRWIHRELEG